MAIVHIYGGLGNQMFQYAFAYALSRKKNEVFKLDINSFEVYDLRNYGLEKFNIHPVFASKKEVEKLKYKNIHLFSKLLHKLKIKMMTFSNTYYKEQFSTFDKNVYDTTANTYFEGYWQSEKYFKEYRDDLLKRFVLKEKIHILSQQYKQGIESTESISLHVRRGDYVTNIQTNSVHGTCTLDYYKNAVLEIEKKVKKPHFFLFGDDLDWVKENFDFMENVTFVELDENIPDHEEMYLMSQCKHNIIANSSFSWWGAWLNLNPDKIVIAPQRWFVDMSRNTNDLIPKSWIRL